MFLSVLMSQGCVVGGGGAGGAPESLPARGIFLKQWFLVRSEQIVEDGGGH